MTDQIPVHVTVKTTTEDTFSILVPAEAYYEWAEDSARTDENMQEYLDAQRDNTWIYEQITRRTPIAAGDYEREIISAEVQPHKVSMP